MTAFVDCKALAVQMAERRKPWAPEITEALAVRFGIDATRALTEIEGIDAGRAADWGDLPKIHALHYVPLERFTPADVMLMVIYGQSPQTVLPIARLMLERNPVVEAEHYKGDLLMNTAYLIAFEALGQPCALAIPCETVDTVWIREIIEAAERRLWEIFEARAREEGVPAAEVRAARQRVRNGPPTRTLEWSNDLDDLMNAIAEARSWIDPPLILLRAYRRDLSSRHIPPHLHIAAPRDRATTRRVPSGMVRRDTVFEIAARRSGRGVRLLSRSVRSMEGWRGTVFDAVDAAKDFAQKELGIAKMDWQVPSEDGVCPVEHMEME